MPVGHSQGRRESADLPAFIPPMLPTLVNEPPEGDNWQHEIKFDGYRTQIHVANGSARALAAAATTGPTRTADWSMRRPDFLSIPRFSTGRSSSRMLADEVTTRASFSRCAAAPSSLPWPLTCSI